jgi:hypothetical protein
MGFKARASRQDDRKLMNVGRVVRQRGNLKGSIVAITVLHDRAVQAPFWCLISVFIVHSRAAPGQQRERLPRQVRSRGTVKDRCLRIKGRTVALNCGQTSVVYDLRPTRHRARE